MRSGSGTAFILFGALVAGGAARAATFEVDATSDDGGPALRACTAAPADCSLRGAITAGNLIAGPHTIRFAIPTSDPGFIAASSHWRIAPATALPNLVQAFTIDGYTQPGAAPNTNSPDQGGSNAVLAIELRGPGLGAGAFPGFGMGSFNAALTLRGIAIGGFSNALALFGAAGPHVIEGNFFGLAIDGVTPAPNQQGIRADGHVTIGGMQPAQRNVVAANTQTGIDVSAGNITTVVIAGNLVGVAADGVTVPGRQDTGIVMAGPLRGAVVGGSTPDARNVIAGNAFQGIYYTGDAFFPAAGAPNRIIGNWLGLGADGTTVLGNGLNPTSPSQPQPAITIFRGGRCGIAVGGIVPGEGNRIVGSGGAGIHVGTCIGAPLHGNVLRDNRRGSIDLSTTSNPDGATQNDPGDPDGNDPNVAGNRLQNSPEIVGAVGGVGAGAITITYRVDTLPANAAYPLRIEFIADDGVVFVDDYPLASAQATRTVTIPVASPGQLPRVASATDADGNTSELADIGVLFADGFE